MPEPQGLDYAGPEDVARRGPRAFVVSVVFMALAAGGPALWAVMLTDHYQRLEGFGDLSYSTKGPTYRYRCLHLPRTVGRSLPPLVALVGFVALLPRAGDRRYAFLVIPVLLALMFLFKVMMYIVEEAGFP